MNKAIVAILAFALLTTVAAMPVMAAQPTVVPCNFVNVAWSNLDPGKIWYSDDGQILHVRGRIANARLFDSMSTTRIGDAWSSTDMDFNLKTGQGNANRNWSFTFTQASGFGVGTINGVAVIKATSLYNDYAPGVQSGKFVATHGTGDFENAKLMAEFAAGPFPGKTQTILRFNFTGELTFHG